MSQLQELGAAIAGLQSQASNSTTALYQIEDSLSKKNWASVQDEDVFMIEQSAEAADTVYTEFSEKRAGAHDDFLTRLTTEVLQVSNAALAQAILNDQALDQQLKDEKEKFSANMEAIAKDEGGKSEFAEAFNAQAGE